MKKQGFTLVELLAVIAILAILVIIALPNVMSMFNQARKNSFTTEVKEIYKVAQQQWISDSLFTTSTKEYSRCKSGCSNSLELSGREELEYYIKIDKGGNVTNYYATDGTYQYSYDSGNLKIEDIDGVEQVAGLEESQLVVIGPHGLSTPTDVSYFSYFVDNGEVTITFYDENGPKDVVVPSTIEGHPVTTISGAVFYYSAVTSITFPDTIKAIYGNEDWSIIGDSPITSITLPPNLEHIGDYAFDCSGQTIKKLVIPNKVKFIGESAFGGCGIEELTLGSSVEEIGEGAFQFNNITHVTIPASVTKLEPASRDSYSYYRAAFHENPLRSVTIKGKSSASEFAVYHGTVNGVSKTPFAWASDVTCVKDNDTNVTNGCITWEP